MNIIVHNSKASGEVKIPASKSDMHRAIIAASLANGISVIKNITLSNDINATIKAFEALGAKIDINEDELIIQGIKEFNNPKNTLINCDESGSTLRFIIPILSMFNNEFTLYGSKTLFSRPLNIYEEIYKKQGLNFKLSSNTLTVQGKINPDEYVIKGDVSSQFISGLLFTLPLLNQESKITIIKPFESESYVNMTLKTLKSFGIEIRRISRTEFIIPGNQKYTPRVYEVEGDYSQFAFFAVLGAINGEITCSGLNKDSIQGDRLILDILKSFNVDYHIRNDKITIHKCYEIKGSLIDLSDCPDLGPICMILSLFSLTPVRITNIHRLRLKESNRVDSMIVNLRKLGAQIEAFDNYMIIYPSSLKASKEVLNSFNDHRVMMSLVVLGSMIRGSTLIDNPQCIKKSYVNFYKDIQSLGIEVGLHD